MTAVLRTLAAVAALAFVLWAHDTLLLVFTGILLAIVLRAAARVLANVTRMPMPVALGCVVIGIVLIVGTLAMWRGAAFADQLTALGKTLPTAARDLLRRYGNQPWSPWLAERLRTFDPAPLWRAASGAGGWILASLVGGVTSVAVIVFTGVCFAAEPATYVRGLILLFPPTERGRLASVIDDVGDTLRAWLFARLISMIAVGTFVTVGLTLMHLPFAGTLGVLAGLLSFIPNVGSIGSSIPAIVLALAIDPKSALVVVLIYWLAHFVDDFLVLPIAERRIVSLPPALTVTFQLLLAGPAGIVGVMLAAPLAATAIVLTRRLWIVDDVARCVTTEPAISATVGSQILKP